MKQNDIAVIIVVAAVSALASFLLSGKLFVTPENRQQKVEVVDVISTEFQNPDKAYFNTSSINPATSIQLGGGGNQNPFNDSSR